MGKLLFNLNMAFRAIRTNRLRSILTISIIALGIMALVGILTATEVIKRSVYENFSSMGANTFRITGRVIKKKRGGRGFGIRYSAAENISYYQAMDFKERYNVPATVSVSMSGSGAATVRFGSEKTNPNISTMGVDNAYLKISDTKLDYGRDFSQYEQEFGSYACILGSGVASKLFKKNTGRAIGKTISVGDVKYTVVGVAESKGGSMMMNADNLIFIPLENAVKVYGKQEEYVINVMVDDIAKKEVAQDEAEGLFRVVRKLPIGTANNFSIEDNDNIATMLLESIGVVTIAALFIGIITLLGSVVGLMNIMLVSVAERTREIGVNKALGARSSVIKSQFLTESVLISVLGGILGVILGMLVGNILSVIFNTGFVVPWLWITIGVTLCAIVGVVSGIYPAIKASKLDPIVALRYE